MLVVVGGQRPACLPVLLEGSGISQVPVGLHTTQASGQDSQEACDPRRDGKKKETMRWEIRTPTGGTWETNPCLCENNGKTVCMDAPEARVQASPMRTKLTDAMGKTESPLSLNSAVGWKRQCEHWEQISSFIYLKSKANHRGSKNKKEHKTLISRPDIDFYVNRVN